MKKRCLLFALSLVLLLSALIPAYGAQEEVLPLEVSLRVYSNLLGQTELQGLYKDNVLYISPEDVCRMTGARIRTQGYDAVTFSLHDGLRVITANDTQRLTENYHKKKMTWEIPTVTYDGKLYVSAPEILRYMGATVGFGADEKAAVHMMVSMPYTVLQLYADYLAESGYRFSWAECTGKLVNPADVLELAALDTIMLGYDSNVLAYGLPGFGENVEKQIHTDALLELLRTEGTELVSSEDISVEILGYLSDGTELSVTWLEETMEWAAETGADKKLAETLGGRMDAAGLVVDMTAGCIASVELAKQFANLTDSQKNLMERTLCRVKAGSALYQEHPVMFQAAKEAHNLMTGQYSAGEKAAWDGVYNLMSNAVEMITPPNPFTTAFDVLCGIAKLDPLVGGVLEAEKNITFAAESDDIRILAEQLLWTDAQTLVDNNGYMGKKNTKVQENMKYDMLLSLKASLTARLLLLDTGWLSEPSANAMQLEAEQTAQLLNKAQNARPLALGIYEKNEEDISWIEKLVRSAGFGNVVTIGGDTYYWRYSSASFAELGYADFDYSSTENAMVCMDADGKTKTLFTVCGSGEFAVGNGFVVYQESGSEQGYGTGIYLTDLQGKEHTWIGGGTLRGISEDGRYVFMHRYGAGSDSKRYLDVYDTVAKERSTLCEGLNQFVVYYNGRIYYTKEVSYDEARQGKVDLWSILPDGTDQIHLYTTKADMQNGYGCGAAGVDQIRFTKDHIYFSYGSIGGTGNFMQGARIVQVGYDGADGAVVAGKDVLVDGQFTVTADGQVNSQEHVYLEMYSMGDPLEVTDGNVSLRDPVTGVPKAVLQYGEYGALDGRKLRVEDADGIGMISFVEEHGGKLYCLLHSATITDDPLSWTQRYTRQRTVLLMKDLQTGEVMVLYSC